MWSLARVVLPVILVGCADPDDARTAWLVDALVTDNAVWRSRDPSLLATKYQEMAEDRYDFLRGTLGVWFRDLEAGGAGSRPTAFLNDPEAATVLIIGDPHPENLGTMWPGDGPGPTREDDPPQLLLEFNDFDAAQFGPYLLDVRRAMIGLGEILDQSGCDPACRAPVLAAEAAGWFDEITAIDAGERPFDPTLTSPSGGPTLAPGTSPVIDPYVERVVEDGLGRETLDDALDHGRFVIDAALDDDGDGQLALTDDEAAQADRLIAQYPWPPGARIHDVARRYGVGIASLPAVRYVIAWDRGDDEEDDDELLQLREVVDPPPVPVPVGWPSALFDDDASRSVIAAQTAWSRPDADARLAGLTDGPMAFKAQTWSSFHASLDHGALADALAEGSDADRAAFGALLGRQLGATHARSITSTGGPALPPVIRDLGGRRDRFVDERLDEVERDLTRLAADHARFRGALRDYGPLLGAPVDGAPTGTP
ncbi:MAG: DUF2252 family protein [Myxococcota bacterium]